MNTPLFDEIRDWVFETALPFWNSEGVDRVNGGYVEHFDADGRPADVDFKRVRVIARQIYVFSHAALLGYEPGLEAARHGYRFLTEHAWLGEDGGWARRLSRTGEVTDRTPDLYDLAFVMFALGWYYRASGDEQAWTWIERTRRFIEARMRQPEGGGFVHELPAVGWRQQNPHMHLLEACLAGLEARPDPEIARLADEIVTLFRDKFFDLKSQTLAEFFGEGWSRAPGDEGRWIEPGHQFEWAWILANYQRLTGQPTADLARALVAFGERHGVDPVTGKVFNGVRDDGVPLDRASRTWPNTERIKSAVALYELDGVDPTPVITQSARRLLDFHLNAKPAGTWIEVFDADERPVAEKIPSSTLYHVFLAFAEALRIAPKVS
jgi:N-acylglucosamine 2-epimerase/mannose-6-phosphate isomerase